MHKYLIVDDESNIIVGYCKDIIGLSENKAQNFYNITLMGLRLTEAFIKYFTASKCRISGIHISMLEQDGKIIGSYFFVPEKLISFHKDVIFQEEISLNLSGGFSSAPSFEALEIWDKWMISKPVVINTWASLSKKQRLGWLEVVRIHSNFNKNNTAENKHYYLDMTYVMDSISFFCALGEAMNGPGGYYGFNLDSVEDCFCGGFGAEPPFYLHFNNGNLNELIDQNKIAKTDQVKLQQLKDLLISNQVTLIF